MNREKPFRVKQRAYIILGNGDIAPVTIESAGQTVCEVSLCSNAGVKFVKNTEGIFHTPKEALMAEMREINGK